MVNRKHNLDFPFTPFLQILSVFICVHLWFLPSEVRAQEDAAREVAVNLAEGRVVVCAAKDGIIVATADAHSEPGSRQPVVVTLSALRAGVLLGLGVLLWLLVIDVFVFTQSAGPGRGVDDFRPCPKQGGDLRRPAGQTQSQ